MLIRIRLCEELFVWDDACIRDWSGGNAAVGNNMPLENGGLGRLLDCHSSGAQNSELLSTESSASGKPCYEKLAPCDTIFAAGQGQGRDLPRKPSPPGRPPRLILRREV